MAEIRNPNLQTQGPGGSGGGDMRTTIGFSLLLLVILLGYQFFFKPKPTTPPAENQAQTQAADAAQRATAPAETGIPIFAS